MKPVKFLGDSLKSLREFPVDARNDAGYQLDKVQRGQQPSDFKPMPSIGKWRGGNQGVGRIGNIPGYLYSAIGGCSLCAPLLPEEDASYRKA